VTLITAIAGLWVDEASFSISKDGIQLRAMDPSHVAMVDLEWPNTIFQEFTSVMIQPSYQ